MIFNIDKGVKTFLAAQTGLTDTGNPATSDIIISSNAWAFRNRIRQKGTLEFPFCNFRLLPGGIVRPEKTFPKNYALTVEGHYDPDLEDRVRILAFTARYEATFWSHRFSNTMYTFQEIFTENYKDHLIPYTYEITGIDYNFEAPLTYTNLEFDPNWEAAGELDRGNIHSVDLSFEVDAYIFKTIGSFKGSNCSVSGENPAVITCAGHGLTTGTYVSVEFDNGDTGRYQVTVIDDDSFSVEYDNTISGAATTADWYAGVSPVDDVVVEMFYNNGVIDEQENPDRTFEVTPP